MYAPTLLGPSTVAPKPIDVLSPIWTLVVGRVRCWGLLELRPVALSRTAEPVPI